MCVCQLVQELQPQDNEKRLEYAMRVQDLVNGDPGFLQKLIMSDESLSFERFCQQTKLRNLGNCESAGDSTTSNAPCQMHGMVWDNS